MVFWNTLEGNQDRKLQKLLCAAFKTFFCHLEINPVSGELQARPASLRLRVQTGAENTRFWLNEQACVQAAPKANYCKSSSPDKPNGTEMALTWRRTIVLALFTAREEGGRASACWHVWRWRHFKVLLEQMALWLRAWQPASRNKQTNKKKGK